METKDWILLLIPIGCNGLFIFCFQSFVSHKLKKSEKHREVVFDIINNLSKMVCENYEMIILLINECSPGFTPVELMKPAPFENLWNPIAHKTVQIYNYAQIHNVILKSKNISLDDYVNSYEILASFLGKIINKPLSTEDKQQIFFLITEFKNSTIALNTKLEQVLSKKI